MKYDNRKKMYFYVVLTEKVLYHLIECFRIIFRNFAKTRAGTLSESTVRAPKTSMRDKNLIGCYGAAHGRKEVLSWSDSTKFKMIN